MVDIINQLVGKNKMQLTVPLGVVISESEENKEIKIRVPKTKFWVIGEQKTSKKWDAFLTHPSGYKKQIKKDISTKEIESSICIILKTPFPYSGKKAENSRIIIRFIRKLIN